MDEEDAPAAAAPAGISSQGRARERREGRARERREGREGGEKSARRETGRLCISTNRRVLELSGDNERDDRCACENM